MPRWWIQPSACSPTRHSIISCPAKFPSVKAIHIPTSCLIRNSRPPTATSLSPPATTTSTSSSATCWERRNLPAIRPTSNNTDRLKHRNELVGKLTALTKRMKRDDLLAKLEAQGVPAGPINDLEQVFSDRQVVHRGMKLEIPSAAAKDGTIPGVRTPLVFDGWKAAADRPAPHARRAYGGDFERDRRGLELLRSSARKRGPRTQLFRPVVIALDSRLRGNERTMVRRSSIKR